MKIASALAFLLMGVALGASAQTNRYQIEDRNPYDRSSGPREIEMRDRFNPDPSKRFRGEMDTDGSVRMRNQDGTMLRGNIDSDGYGRLRDPDGNTYRVKPQ